MSFRRCPTVLEEDLHYKVVPPRCTPRRRLDFASNLVDFQHLTSVHGIPDAIPKSVVFDKYVINSNTI